VSAGTKPSPTAANGRKPESKREHRSGARDRSRWKIPAQPASVRCGMSPLKRGARDFGSRSGKGLSLASYGGEGASNGRLKYAKIAFVRSYIRRSNMPLRSHRAFIGGKFVRKTSSSSGRSYSTATFGR